VPSEPTSPADGAEGHGNQEDYFGERFAADGLSFFGSAPGRTFVSRATKVWTKMAAFDYGWFRARRDWGRWLAAGVYFH
jgi:hypothetical protein